MKVIRGFSRGCSGFSVVQRKIFESCCGFSGGFGVFRKDSPKVLK